MPVVLMAARPPRQLANELAIPPAAKAASQPEKQTGHCGVAPALGRTPFSVNLVRQFWANRAEMEAKSLTRAVARIDGHREATAKKNYRVLLPEHVARLAEACVEAVLGGPAAWPPPGSLDDLSLATSCFAGDGTRR